MPQAIDKQTTDGLSHVRKFLRDAGMPIPLGQTLGFHVVGVEPGQVTLEMPVGPHLANTLGYLHGGAVGALCDAVMGLSILTLLEADETATTVEFKVNFVRPVFDGTVRAVGHVVKQGRTLSLIEADVLDERDRLVAKATSTFMTLRGEQAKGR